MFRRRLVADIGGIVTNFAVWTQPKPTSPGEQHFSVSPIWDYGYETLGDAYANASHLRPYLFVRVTRFYSACGRFDEIRVAYNQGVIEVIKSKGAEQWTTVLNSYLKDMANVVREITREGGDLLRDIALHYQIESRASELWQAESHPEQEA